MRTEPGGFLSLWAFDVDEHGAFNDSAQRAIAVLSELEGFLQARVLHNVDEHARYVVATEWADVGSFRRAMSSHRAKVEVWPFLATMRDEPSAFETLAHAVPGGVATFPSSATGA